MERYLEQFDKCLQHEQAFCTAACPFNLDVDAFISRLREGRFNAAYKIYRDATGFPFIAVEVCTEVCKEACLINAVRQIKAAKASNNDAETSDGINDSKRDSYGESAELSNSNCGNSAEPIELLKLEKAVLAYATRTEPTRYNVPGKNKSVAIIGAGISGMACALRLATKKYDVTIYEKTDAIGGTLLANKLNGTRIGINPEIVRADFERQMQYLNYKIKFNTEIKSLEDVIKQGYEDNNTDGDVDSKSAVAARSAVAAVMRSNTINSTRETHDTYDAIYVATGADGNDFGISVESAKRDKSSLCTIIDKTAVFLGGSLVGCDKIHALADGLRMATAIDNYTLTKQLKYPEYPTTEVKIDETQYIETPSIKPSSDILADKPNSDAQAVSSNPEASDTSLNSETSAPDEFNGASTNSVREHIYTKEEAIAEAARCMKCHCSACRLHCDLTDYLHKWPLRLKDEILATTAPGKSELHATPAVRTINMCTHCGLCESTCPENIDMDNLIQQARIRMHKLDKMPWAFNDFFLRDMEFTNSAAAYLCRKPASGDIFNRYDGDESRLHDGYESRLRDGDSCRYAFFPGCQLGASSPEIVIKTYELLREIEPSSGIMLGCCGIPANWAGNSELRESVSNRIRSDWQSLGKPIMVLACPTCRNTFAKYLPEIETTYIYDLIADALENHDTLNAKSFGHSSPANGCVWAVFDPCATSQGDSVRDSVRKICNAININLEPLPIQEKWTACCSYGGHGAVADPAFTKFVREKRINESELPYITYCINCCDAFLQEGKSATHILNLLFDIEPRLYTVTKRRENRIELKEKLLKKFWGESPIDDTLSSVQNGAGDAVGTAEHDSLAQDGADDALSRSEAGGIVLEMSKDIRQKLSDSYILEQEAANVVAFCERTGRTLHDTEADTYTGYRKIGNLTYWVTYRKPAETSARTGTDESVTSYELLNAYTHRMEIDLEMIWNGKKIDIDM